MPQGRGKKKKGEKTNQVGGRNGRKEARTKIKKMETENKESYQQDLKRLTCPNLNIENKDGKGTQGGKILSSGHCQSGQKTYKTGNPKLQRGSRCGEGQSCWHGDMF